MKMANQYRIGQIILGRFVVAKSLGHGGVGESYKAMAGDRHVALKVLDARFVTGDRDPAAMLKTLRYNVPGDDPAVVPAEVVEDENRRIIVSAFIEGCDLRRILDARRQDGAPPSLLETLDLVDRVLDRLAALPPFAVHGALKPENIIVEGATPRSVPAEARAWFTDFNLHKLMSFSKYAQVQLARGAAYAYLAPEFIGTGGRPDRRADIYAVGALAYELAVGKPPTKRSAVDRAGGMDRARRGRRGDRQGARRGPPGPFRRIHRISSGAAGRLSRTATADRAAADLAVLH
ncbi:MAG: protein kinase [Deltaproteobacteria bacterium]|nr:protein kinase [Deltaproteobacteria bacterium]